MNLHSIEDDLGFWLACQDIVGDDNGIIRVSRQDAQMAHGFATQGLDRAARRESRERVVRAKLANVELARLMCKHYHR